MNHLPPGDQLEPCSSAREWLEWSHQSFILFQHWCDEITRTGLKNSTTGTWFATIPWAVHRLCDMLALDALKEDDLIVEIGPGPGPMPQAVLRRTRKKIKYLAIELNPNYAQRLTSTIQDPRLKVLNEDASHIGSIMEDQRAKAKLVLSSMPFSRDTRRTQAILHQIHNDVLTPDGKLLVWNFMSASIAQVETVFGSENSEREVIRINLPPLKTILAKKPVHREKDPQVPQIRQNDVGSTTPPPILEEYPAPVPVQDHH
ncbi:MAG: rRNA adenine N-6-methyltransferase family protein [Candidatus Altimarinota bacterium]